MMSIYLSRRASSCASVNAETAVDDMPLRIGAVFVILGVSTLACAFPLLASAFPRLKVPQAFFFAIRHFGTGVLIATAFCHLLPTAFILLHDPCLSEWWTEGYAAMPGAIALGAVMLVTIVEMCMHPGRHHHRKPEPTSGSVQTRKKGQFNGRSSSIGRGLSLFGGEAANEAAQGNGDDRIPPTAEIQDESLVPLKLSVEQKKRVEIMQCVLLELGILFHSVFIGMALSVSIGGREFVILLIAIVFHQTFEGLALGARIAAIEWPQRAVKPWLMALAYGMTTPIGQALGLATRALYSPDSEVGLILVGVMNAISSGLLIFASLIELLSEDFLSDESWQTLRGRRRAYAFLLLLAGAMGMSLVGAWA
ncbi:hypothetical protein TruAng_004771 [Truncatella angustata]|nr:hypothetical protein TruAng_004771 [Truncatella angustata]